MAATILAGSIGALAMTSVRASGAAEGNTIQNYHVPATAIDAASKTNEGVFSGRANRLFSTPLALDGDAFGINIGASAEHDVAVSSRERGRKLQDEDDGDQCDSAITVTSALINDAEGCYEYVDGQYYLSADGEHAIGMSTLVVAGIEVGSIWVYGSLLGDVDQFNVSAVCYYQDTDVSLDQIPEWECDTDTDPDSVTFSTVSSEEFSVSCGCSETPAPTGNGTNGEFTGVPTMSPTIAPTMSPTGMPTMSPTGAPTMSPTVAPTISPIVASTMPPTVAPTAIIRSVDSSSTAFPTASPTASPTDGTNVGTLPFKMSTLGMVGASVAAIFVGLMPFVV